MIALSQGASADAGLYSVAGRRVARKTWRVRPALADVGAIGTGTVVTATARAVTATIDPSLVLTAADLSPEIAYRPSVVMIPARSAPCPPRRSIRPRFPRANSRRGSPGP